MADNVNITAGAGVIIATDEDASNYHYQRIKLTDGLADATAPINADIGVKANALRVVPANNITDATYIGDIKFGEAVYTEDIATPGTIIGLGVMMERDDALGGLTPAEGDWASLRCDANGALWTHDDALDAAIDGSYLNTNMNIAGTDCVGGSGANAAGVLRVTIATDDECNNYLGTIDTDTGNIVTAVQLIDDAIYIDDADWTNTTSKHMLVGGLFQGTPQTVTDGDVAPFQVDVNGCLILGTSAKAIGKLAANDGVDIGNVDVTSIIPLTGATNLGKARDVACGANDVGVMALAVRDDTLTTLTPADGDYAPLRLSSTGQLHVTLGALPASTNTIEVVGDAAENANAAGNPVLVGGRYDSGARTLGDTDVGAIALAVDGAVHIDDGGNTITVDGDIGTVSTVTNLSQLNGTAITMDEGVHGTGCQRVTIATDDDGVLSLGIIDDWDATHDATASADGPQLMAVYDSTKPTAVNADGDAVRVLADAYGRLLSGVETGRFHVVYNSADAHNEGEVVHAHPPSAKIVVQSYVISVDAEMWVELQDEASVALTGKFWLKAGGGVAITLPLNAPIVLGVDKNLEVITEGAGNVSVSVTGYTIPG
jgi:hypothetical protein